MHAYATIIFAVPVIHEIRTPIVTVLDYVIVT